MKFFDKNTITTFNSFVLDNEISNMLLLIFFLSENNFSCQNEVFL